MNILEVSSLCKRFGGLEATKDVSLAVKKGEVLGILGPNGAGKSTLLKLISGILVPGSGGIRVEGKISALLNLGEGFNPDFTGSENIHLHCVFKGFWKHHNK